MTGAAAETETTLRLCVTEGCETRLSRFNPSMKCAACEARLEIGGRSIPLPRQPRFAPRPPAPARPTTEGAVPLPGVVPGRERSYAEMIAKPPAVATPAVRKRADTRRLETPPTRIPPRAHDDSKADSKAPGKPSQKRPASPKPRRRAGAPRRYDHDEAIRLFRECGNYTKIANHFGVTPAPIRRLVNSRLDAAEITSIRERFPFPQRGATRRKPTAAVTTPADAECRLELARLAAELDDIHNEQTRLYARWRVTAERHAQLLRDAS